MGKSWKNAGKTENAQKKGAMFTKLAREIAVAAKLGGGDPNGNARLRAAIEAAKKSQCPNDTIERAIKKGTGQLDDGTVIEELVYEGYGPHGVGVMVECQTDNRARTAPDLRLIFKKNEGSLGESGSVAWMFDHVGLIEAAKTGSFDPEEEAIEAGANEVEKLENSYEFYTAVSDLEAVKSTLSLRGWKIISAELSFKAKNKTVLTDEQMKDVSEFLNELDDHDDTHRVHATI